MNNATLSTAAMFLAALVLSCAIGGAQEITIEGFAPPGITSGLVLLEYRRIWNTLAPSRPTDKHALRVTYFSKRAEHHTYSLPEWGGGGAVGTGHIVVALDAEPFLYNDFARITIHELVHIAINRACTNAEVPRWFHEGVAMALSGDVTFTEQLATSRAILTGSLLLLSSIDSVNSFGRARAELAYAQSHQAVLFLVETYGIEVVQEILAAAQESGSFWAGVRESLQLSQVEIESMVRAYLVRKFRLAFFFADTYLFWAAIVVLFLAAYVVTVVRNRRKAALMAQQEALDEQGGAGSGPA